MEGVVSSLTRSLARMAPHLEEEDGDDDDDDNDDDDDEEEEGEEEEEKEEEKDDDDDDDEEMDDFRNKEAKSSCGYGHATSQTKYVASPDCSSDSDNMSCSTASDFSGKIRGRQQSWHRQLCDGHPVKIWDKLRFVLFGAGVLLNTTLRL